MTSSFRLPKGYSDFQQLRQADLHYVDKTLLVEHVLNDSAQIILLPRPRRFGKTLNLSMLRYFFEKTTEDRRALFAGLAIEQNLEAQKHFQRYPTIFLTFKDAKFNTWLELREHVAILLSEVYRSHDDVLKQGDLSHEERLDFEALLARKASDTVMAQSLRTLCKHLHTVHGEKVVLLIDEYDTPIHEAHEHGYYDKAISFFRGLLSAALKDNVYVFRGVMTGILRVAKESIFSGLNNLGVYSLTSTMYSDMFGFTEDEVHGLVRLAGHPELMDGLRAWYNGYDFGGRVIYNPWSIVHYLYAPADGLRAYWVNTSDNGLIRAHVLQNRNDVKSEFEQLLHGEGLDKPLYENISMPALQSNGDMVWSLLLFTGYLKPHHWYMVDNEPWAKLVVPNLEVRSALTQMVRGWFNEALGTSSQVQRLLKAMLQGEAREMQYLLQAIVRDNASYHDAREDFFHGLVLGLLVNLSETHEVHSNRESGFGRCDVLVSPKHAGKPGIALEFKVVDTDYHETMDGALKTAMKQLHDRDYVSTLRERGASPIYAMAIAFEGKRVELEIKTLPLKTRAAKKKPTRAREPVRSKKPLRSTQR